MINPLKETFDELTETEISRAFHRVEHDVRQPRKSTYPLEVMTWSRHEKIWGEHQCLLRTSPECERFYILVQELQWRDPTDEELSWLLRHEETCETGWHSDRRLKQDLELPPLALRSGAPEHGLLSPDVFADHIRTELAKRSVRKRLRIASLREIKRTPPESVAEARGVLPVRPDRRPTDILAQSVWFTL